MNIEIFKNNGFEIRGGVNEDNNPYFVLADVCRALGLEQVSRVKKQLLDGVTNSKGISEMKITDSLGRNQITTVISESNLYKLIFKSRKDEALKFQDWVTSEVLPSIRKHGGYIQDDILSDTDKLVDLIVKLRDEKNQIEKTKAEIGSRREATAMATASVAVKKANKLEIELDKSKNYCTVKRMEMLMHGQSFKWRELKSACRDLEIASVDVFDANYGTVKAYPKEAWSEAYGIDLETVV